MGNQCLRCRCHHISVPGTLWSSSTTKSLRHVGRPVSPKVSPKFSAQVSLHQPEAGMWLLRPWSALSSSFIAAVSSCAEHGAGSLHLCCISVTGRVPPLVPDLALCPLRLVERCWFACQIPSPAAPYPNFWHQCGKQYEWLMNVCLFCFWYTVHCQWLKAANKPVRARQRCLHSLPFTTIFSCV